MSVDTPKDQREMLEQSEAEASKEHPKTFRDAATEDKIVEVGNDKQSVPIRGIDPPEATDAADNRLKE